MKNFFQKNRFKDNGGHLLLQIIIFSAVALVMIMGIANWAKVNIIASRQSLEREKAIQLAEAGIDYYRWHLAHNHTDYTDGTGNPGPYVHSVKDKSGNVAGEFSLNITAPLVGSTKVTIQSTGRPLNSSVTRTIKVEMAIPSLAKYAIAANDFMRFGEGTEVFGPIHSNNGIRFDGLAHNVITSAVVSYDDPDHTGAVEFGVHTHLNQPAGTGANASFRPLEAPPTNPVPNRIDVFEAGRQFPIAPIDFVGLTNDLAQIKADAQAGGKYFAPSGSQGYLITLKTNNTFDIHRVTSQTNPPNGCSNSQTGWGTWSVNNKTLIGNYPIPANGLIFVEDNAWVEGTINNSRVTIASGRFPDNPANRPQLTVNNNLKYTNFDGTDIISLIAQGNLNVGLVSANVLRIDGALVSQNGRVGRYYYPSACGANYIRSTITLYGMIATNLRYGFSYTDGTGYQIRNINYDPNLLYSPPPSFPLTSNQYEILSWEEI